MPEFVNGLEARYREISRRVAAAAEGAGRDPASVHLIAVSKKQSADAIEALYRLGQRDFGENYVQELVAKAEELARRGCSEIRWHFIGHLQTNKARALVPFVHCVHSVDSERLASELGKRWALSGRAGRLPVFVEVNISREAGKAGVSPEGAVDLARAVARFSELELLGMMCVPAAEALPPELAARFRELRELGSRGGGAGQLSMGMSSDFELAIVEGATHVRVGTAIFGPREG